MGKKFNTLLDLLTLAAVILSLYFLGPNPRVLFYGIGFAMLFRVLSLWGLLSLHRRPRAMRWRPLLERITRRPTKPQTEILRSHPGGTLSLPVYAGVFTSIFFIFGFMLINVDGNGKMAVDARTFLFEVLAGLQLAAIYWLEDMFTRQITADYADSDQINLAYDHSLGAMVLAIFTGVFTHVAAVWFGTGVSPWVLCAPLLMVKHLVGFKA